MAIHLENSEALSKLMDPMAPLQPLSEQELGEMFRIMGQRWTSVIGAELRAAQQRAALDSVQEIQSVVMKLTKLQAERKALIEAQQKTKAELSSSVASLPHREISLIEVSVQSDTSPPSNSTNEISVFDVPMSTLLDRSASNIPRPKTNRPANESSKPKFDDEVLELDNTKRGKFNPKHHLIGGPKHSILKQ